MWLTLMVMALVACHHERSTITGSFGNGIVAGAVVMADGSSPAGVEVAVTGTGMRMLLGDDGTFAFANVPESAELIFHRGALMATLPVSAGERDLSVQLGANAASAGGRRRASNPSTQKVFETEGLVVSASATELVVLDSHRQELTFVLNGDTVIRKGNAALTAAALTEGTRVHVKATLANDVRTAVQVIVQNENDDDGEDGENEAKEFEGTIRSVSAAELIVFTSHQVEETFVLNGDTVIRKGNRTLAPSDLKEGDRVHVKASTEGATKTATLVILQNSGKS